MMPTNDFPTVAQMGVQSFHSRKAGKPIAISEIIQFASRARSLEPRLTDRGAMVIYVAAHNPGISAKDIEYALAGKPGVILAVLKGLAVDLGLIEVNGAGWMKTVSVTDAGQALADEAAR
jgi:hypothetical protein